MKLLKAALIGTILLWSPTVQAEETPAEVTAIYDQVQKLLTQHYPQAKFERSNGNFVAKFDTRTFMIHHALKTGEWQEARPQEGPNRKGIQCSISSAPGRWAGAAMVPQSFEYHYFTSLLMAPYNEKLNRHLIAHLDYPNGTSPQLLTEYQKVLAGFSSK